MKERTETMRKRDAIVLVLLCGFVVLCAGAGRMHSKLLMCTTNMQKTGQAMAIYTDSYDGKLPTLQYYDSQVPCIESTYLISRNRIAGPLYIHLGCLYGAGLIPDGQSLFCPGIDGWRGETTNMGTNNGTYLGAVHAVTKKFVDIKPGVSQPNQGWKATKGYCYWPLSKRRVISPGDITAMPSSCWHNYVVGLPFSATKADDMDTSRPMVTDRKFHRDSGGGWMVNCLHPDGHVTYQPQPKADGLNGYGVQGTWGMHSLYENCQFTSDICNGTNIISEAEKASNLATGVPVTSFVWALQP
jgi:hypothetical protein